MDLILIYKTIIKNNYSKLLLKKKINLIFINYTIKIIKRFLVMLMFKIFQKLKDLIKYLKIYQFIKKFYFNVLGITLKRNINYLI